jgi:DNA polymerase-3 subunit alpha
VLNKRSVESLIKAGAFDSLGHPRKGLGLVFEEIIDHVLVLRREEELGISTLFSLLVEEAPTGGSGFGEARREIPDLEFSKAERLAFEKEMLGLYVSDHPLAGYEAALRRLSDLSIAELVDQASAAGGGPFQSEFVTLGGVVTNLSRRYTKGGELMATFTLEDLESSIEVFCFPRTMQEFGMRLESDAIVCVRGRPDVRDDVPKLIARDITRPEFAPDDANLPIEVAVPVLALTESLVTALRELVVDHPGPVPVHLRLGEKLLRLPPQFNVDPGGGFVGALKELFGAQAMGA